MNDKAKFNTNAMEAFERRRFLSGSMMEAFEAPTDMPMSLAPRPVGMAPIGMSAGGLNQLKLDDTAGTEKVIQDGVVVGEVGHELSPPGGPVPLPYPNTGRAVFASKLIDLQGEDEVLVSFEHGDVDRPVILGRL